MGFVLRDYQTILIHKIRDSLARHRRTLACSATGSGKTVVATHMLDQSAKRGKSSVFVVHRKELLDQTSTALDEQGVEHGLIAGGRSASRAAVQIATIQTLARRVDSMEAPDLIVVDEAKHAAAASYRQMLEAWPTAYVVGLDATPERADGKGLDDLFDDMVMGPSVAWLMEQGHLAKYRLIAPPNGIDLSGVHKRGGDFARNELAGAVDHTSIIGDAVGHYKRHVGDGRCLVYCVSRAHAKHVEAAYRAAGVDARYCAGDTDAGERRAMVRGFQFGNPRVLVSVDLFGEGLDVPGLDAVQLLRPTQSLALHLQQIGRALRPDGDKVALILDHAGNTWRHGLPDDDRDWTLEGSRGKKKRNGEEGVGLKHCPDCFAIYAASKGSCPLCGNVPPVAERTPEEIEGELAEIDVLQMKRKRRSEEGEARTLEALVRLGMERGYKIGWAARRHAVRTKTNPENHMSDARKILRAYGG